MIIDHRRVKLGEAQRFIEQHHTHSRPLKRHMFSIAVHLGERDKSGEIEWQDTCGVATVDNCSSAWSSDYNKLELRRLCFKRGTPKNVASYLLSQVAKAAFGMGAFELITYTQPWENGASLRACGWRLMMRAKISLLADGEPTGGRMTWILDRSSPATEKNREWTNDVVEATNERWAELMNEYYERSACDEYEGGLWGLGEGVS